MDTLTEDAIAEVLLSYKRGDRSLVDTMRAIGALWISHDQEVRQPQRLLDELLRDWSRLPDMPSRLTAKEITTEFSLHSLDKAGPARRERAIAEGKTIREAEALVTDQAASALGEILRAEPILVTPHRTNRGMTYHLDELQAAYERIAGEQHDASNGTNAGTPIGCDHRVT